LVFEFEGWGGQERAEAQIRPFLVDGLDGLLVGDDDVGPIALKVIEGSGLGGAVKAQAGEDFTGVLCALAIGY
jgi:hypothetical protein